MLQWKSLCFSVYFFRINSWKSFRVRGVTVLKTDDLNYQIVSQEHRLDSDRPGTACTLRSCVFLQQRGHDPLPVVLPCCSVCSVSKGCLYFFPVSCQHVALQTTEKNTFYPQDRWKFYVVISLITEVEHGFILSSTFLS